MNGMRLDEESARRLFSRWQRSLADGNELRLEEWLEAAFPWLEARRAALRTAVKRWDVALLAWSSMERAFNTSFDVPTSSMRRLARLGCDCGST